MIRDDKDSKEREQVRCQEMRRNKGNMRSKKQRGERKDGKRREQRRDDERGRDTVKDNEGVGSEKTGTHMNRCQGKGCDKGNV